MLREIKNLYLDTLDKPRFIAEYMTAAIQVRLLMNPLRTAAQSSPALWSPRASAFSLVHSRVRSSSFKYRVVSGLEGRKKKTTIAKTSEGSPSMRKRIRQCVMAGLLILATPYEMRPENAPARAPQAIKRPTLFANSVFL